MFYEVSLRYSTLFVRILTESCMELYCGIDELLDFYPALGVAVPFEDRSLIVLNTYMVAGYNTTRC